MKYFSLLFLSLCSLVFVFYLIGVVLFLSDREPNDKCEMTYMFEYPQYVRVSQSIDQKYSKYGLYAYGEGRITKKARNMYFDGIPVLFIPGNAGSHHQVRSLSSVALRKALNSGSPYHFDYFSVDLNSEFSALYGPVLYDQLEYVLHSISRILKLYEKSPSSPKQVILIGHSVGGIVAKKAIAELLRNNKHLVSILINLAAPIQRPPVYFDRQISTFYKTSFLDSDSVVTISIGGGYSDFLVPSYLIETEGNNTLNLVATNIPKGWVESNHVQIVWCKQLVLALNRALFDSVDSQTRQISSNRDFIKGVFKHHLIHNSGTMHYLKPDFPKLTKINYKGEWIESLYKQYSIHHKKGLKQPHWHMVRFTALPTYEMITILAVNLEVSDWVFACNAAYPNGGGRVCLEGEHLSQYSEIVPTSKFKRRLITLNMHELRKTNTENTHVVFRALSTSEPVTFHVDIYGSSERKSEMFLPKFYLTKQTVLSQTPEKAVIYDLIIPELENLLQVYQLYVEPISCTTEQHHATATLIVPWANESIHSHFTEALNKPFLLRIQNPKPRNANAAIVRLTLEPTCTYKISVRLHILGVFSQIARYYSTSLITYLAVAFLLGFQRQISLMGKTGTVPIFFSALRDGLKQGWIVVLTLLVSKMSYPFLMDILQKPEFMISSCEGVALIAPLFLFLVSIMAMLIIVATFAVSLFTLESTVHKLTLKLLARTVALTIRFSDYFMTFLQKVPFLVSLILVSLCFVTCGGLSLCVGLIFYYLKLTQMSQDYCEQVAWFVLKKVAKKIKNAFTKSNKDSKNSPDEKTTVESPAIENLTKPSISNSEDNDDEQRNINTKTPDLEVEKIDNIGEKSDENSTSKITDESSRAAKHLLETEHHSETSTTHDEESRNEHESEQSTKEHNDEADTIRNLSPSTFNPIFFHSSMFFIWAFITVLNIPAVLTWAHNFKYSRNLIPDESFLPGLILSLSAFPLWQFELPRINRTYTTFLRIVILCFITISLIYATVSIYRLNYMLTILFALIILQQCYAPKINEENKEELVDTDGKLRENKYDEAKMKID